MTLKAYRPAAVLLLALHLHACARWEPVAVSPREFIEEEQPERVRVVPVTGSPVTVSDAQIVNDTIMVIDICASSRPNEDGNITCVNDTTRVAALDDVEAVEISQSSVGGRALAGGMALVLGALMVVGYTTAVLGDSDD